MAKAFHIAVIGDSGLAAHVAAAISRRSESDDFIVIVDRQEEAADRFIE
jgi:hypothetical protein